MMTARLAFSYDRDVFALPGRIDDPRSQGCNFLIRSKIAEPIISTEDLIGSLGLKTSRRRKVTNKIDKVKGAYSKRLDSETVDKLAEIMVLISREKGVTVEEIASISDITYSQAASLTSMLEMDGFIQIDLLQRCFIIIEKNG